MRNHRLISIFIAAILMLGLPGFAAPVGGFEAAKAQPELVALAMQNPGQAVRVIAQKKAGAQGVEALVAKLDGRVTADLSIIDAFAAEMTAGAALELALDESVGWVSLDATTISTSLVTLTVADTFNVRSYSNQDGSQNWSTDWIEINDDGKVDGGKVKIDKDQLKLDDKNRGIQRSVDLSMTDTATLSLDYRRDGLDKPSKYIDLEISTDGGATWNKLYRFQNGKDSDLLPFSVDITRYRAANTIIRFLTSPDDAGKLYVDNFQIEFSMEDTGIVDPLPVIEEPAIHSTSTEPVFVTWATEMGLHTANSYPDMAKMVDSALGPNGAFGLGKTGIGSFAGFAGEARPGYAITKVEMVLYGYTPSELDAANDPKIFVCVNSICENAGIINHHAFDDKIGAAQAGWVYSDITKVTDWKWANFESNLEIVIDHSKFNNGASIYYDAIGLRVTSAAGTDNSLDALPDTTEPDELIDPSQQVNVYNQVIGASQLWNTNSKLQGKDVRVAVVDSGIAKVKDLKVKSKVNFNDAYHDSADRYGHGTFVAGIIAGNGKSSKGKYIGVAPKATLYNVRVSADDGMTYVSDVIESLQWIYENKDKYKIRVVNLSLNQSVPESYHTSPLDAAVEILWFNGIVVVVSAGNNGTATLYPPANDPFVITVGATDDRGTLSINDDAVTSFSAYGTTEDGFPKPDLVAPGRNVIGLLPENDKLSMGIAHRRNRVDSTYFKMSGTSVSAPMVSGAVALLLQDEPGLNPDQVKYRLMATANKNWPGYDATTAGAGILDIYSAVYANTTDSANQGLLPSQLLYTGDNPVAWGSVGWNSVGWNSVGWNSVGWNSVGWNSVGWNSVGWNSVGWNSDHWDE